MELPTTPPIRVAGIDHVVLTVRDISATVAFYEQVLGMRHERFGDGRDALHFGDQKINLHQAGHELEPKAAHPTSGSADLCFVTVTPLADVVARLQDAGVDIEEGPVRRTGAAGPIDSVYLRDPDGNLLELSTYP
jgi:catechol 2,3-dioxygenase-like lactoylglutathione lyase family enzyme